MARAKQPIVRHCTGSTHSTESPGLPRAPGTAVGRNLNQHCAGRDKVLATVWHGKIRRVKLLVLANLAD